VAVCEAFHPIVAGVSTCRLPVRVPGCSTSRRGSLEQIRYDRNNNKNEKDEKKKNEKENAKKLNVIR
jgi:hypothetical protein